MSSRSTTETTDGVTIRVTSTGKRSKYIIESVMERRLSSDNCSSQILMCNIDKALSYIQHIQNMKMRVTTCNNLLHKFANSE